MSTKDYRKGMLVEVMAGGDLEEGFSGAGQKRNDPANFLVFVEHPETGEVWGMPTCEVYPLTDPLADYV